VPRWVRRKGSKPIRAGFDSLGACFSFNLRFPKLVVTDAGYNDNNTARAAAVVFDHWGASQPFREYVLTVGGIAPYEPGQFYKRELPCLMALFDSIEEPISTFLVDGHTWLSDGRPGLGHYLFEALGRRVPVVGIAKRPFVDGCAVEVRRGKSDNPLHVTSDGISFEDAANAVRGMHGPHRIPTLLKRVDAMSRGR